MGKLKDNLGKTETDPEIKKFQLTDEEFNLIRNLCAIRDRQYQDFQSVISSITNYIAMRFGVPNGALVAYNIDLGPESNKMLEIAPLPAEEVTPQTEEVIESQPEPTAPTE